MKTWRPWCSSLAVSVLVAITLAGGSPPALAVVSIASSGITAVPYGGIVDGVRESVRLSGRALVSFKVVRDPDFGKVPSVLLTIDLSNVTGVGVKSGQKYVTSGGQRLLRPLVPVDEVEITFAFYPSGVDGPAQARQALASFTLTYDLAAQRLSSATASPVVNADKLLE